jgi:putative SOS response-associated peptidase YedK
MCGRFALFAERDQLAKRFKLTAPIGPSQPSLFPLQPRYNIAPTQTVPAVRPTLAGRALSYLRWGLIPSWSTDAKIAYKLINARSETVASKPAFRAAFKKHRCLIPASGFYEWRKIGAGSKQPYFIRPCDGDGLFAFAGLWETWNDPQGQVVESCTILTTEANELMQPLHDRMPVILDPASEDLWLDPLSPADALRALFVPFDSDRMESFPVSSWVSNARNEGPKCLGPAEK